ncbi:hypothetical protein LAZ67_8000846 [Cordylochernes scorpioides]|uniref:Uncharacterized protein n=1 Tax=Cordylochernes scorpioides TaxID=51811 RepID=A0ABY6KPT6_9ARAC|nr:hypothetical protein LAZ67_8000846 [Cordylochernes scorpioides]
METRFGNVYNTKKEETKVDDPAKLQLGLYPVEGLWKECFNKRLVSGKHTLQLSENLDISFGTCQTIIKNDMHLKRSPAKFVPHLLTSKQKEHREET